MSQHKPGSGSTDAEAICRANVEALDAGRVDEALRCVADDAVLLIGPRRDGSGIFIGKEQIREWYQSYVAGHSQVRFTEIRAHGDKLTWSAEVAADGWRGQGQDWRPFVGAGIIQGDLLKFGIWVATEEGKAQQGEPESLFKGILDLLQAGKIAAALNLVAEDAVITLIPPPPSTKGVFIGKEQIRGWWTAWVTSHGAVEMSDLNSRGACATWAARVSDDGFRGLRLDWLEADAVGIVQGGLLVAYAYVFTESALSRLQAARAPSA